MDTITLESIGISMSQTPEKLIIVTGTNSNHFYVENVIKAQHEENWQQLGETFAAHDREECHLQKM